MPITFVPQDLHSAIRCRDWRPLARTFENVLPERIPAPASPARRTPPSNLRDLKLAELDTSYLRVCASADVRRPPHPYTPEDQLRGRPARSTVPPSSTCSSTRPTFHGLGGAQAQHDLLTGRPTPTPATHQRHRRAAHVRVGGGHVRSARYTHTSRVTGLTVTSTCHDVPARGRFRREAQERVRRPRRRNSPALQINTVYNAPRAFACTPCFSPWAEGAYRDGVKCELERG